MASEDYVTGFREGMKALVAAVLADLAEECEDAAAAIETGEGWAHLLARHGMGKAALSYADQCPYYAVDHPLDPRCAGQLGQRVVIFELTQLVQAGHLTAAGLLAWRTRLANSAEFPDGAARDGAILAVHDELAKRRGVDPADLPGGPLSSIPDDISGLDNP